jgi:uncharacterized membrane protein YwaF
MITDFKGFGPVHIASLVAAVVIGTVFILLGVRAGEEKQRRRLRLLLAAVIILTRSSRYIMDVFFGVFEWSDLLSLHICHIDLILLTVCRLGPATALFSFCFSSASDGIVRSLFPSNPSRARLPRASCILGATRCLSWRTLPADRERMKPLSRHFCGFLPPEMPAVLVYCLNRHLGTNFLYINKAPAGTVIAALEQAFGCPLCPRPRSSGTFYDARHAFCRPPDSQGSQEPGACVSGSPAVKPAPVYAASALETAFLFVTFHTG